MQLRYLYIGTNDTETDLVAWLALPGARLRWRFRHFGADVAAVDLGSRPVILLADHRPPGSVLPIYEAPDLDETVAGLQAAGWTLEVGPVGTPEGPACVLADASGTAVALLQVQSPEAMEEAFADRRNTHAVRSAAGLVGDP